MPAQGRPAYRFYQMMWSSLDWLYPPRCGGCGQLGSRWCPACQAATHRILPPFCPRCGRSMSHEQLCHNCRQLKPQFHALRSWGSFEGPLRHAMHRLKYSRDVALGEVLARPLVEMVRDLGWSVDLVVPVPLGAARLAERGYNQAALLAKPLALACDLNYNPRSLWKTRDTPSQVGLAHDQRCANVADSFEGLPKLISGKTLLVVDDVTTSGATLNACAVALLSAGAQRVYALTLARAL